MYIQVVFILLAIFLGVEASRPLPLYINSKDTGETIESKDKCDLSEVRTHLKKHGIMPARVTECYTKYIKGQLCVTATVEKMVNVYEETGLSGTAETFAVRKVSFVPDLGIKKDANGKLLPLKDQKTTLTGIQVWEKLKLKDGDKLYKTNPETVKNVKELEKFEIKFDTESVMILEEQNALYVTGAKN